MGSRSGSIIHRGGAVRIGVCMPSLSHLHWTVDDIFYAYLILAIPVEISLNLLVVEPLALVL